MESVSKIRKVYGEREQVIEHGHHHWSCGQRKRLRKFAGMDPHVLLEYERIREVAAAHRTSVDSRSIGLSAVDAHVCLQVALRRKCATAQLAAIGSFASVRSIVHLEGAAAAQDTMTNGTLVRIGDLPFALPHQLVKLPRLGELYLHELLQWIVLFGRGRDRIAREWYERWRFKSVGW